LKSRLVVWGVLLLLPAFCALAQESPLAGDWVGRLEAPGTHMHLVLHVTRLDDGTLKGTLDSPEEGVKGAALEELRLDLNLVRFHCKALDASYLGKLGGDAITGTLKQRGFALKLIFQRGVADPPVRKQTLQRRHDADPATGRNGE
jgi:hypothetical protein